MSPQSNPHAHPTGSAEFDAAEAAGLGGIAWADDGAEALGADAPGSAATHQPAGPPDQGEPGVPDDDGGSGDGESPEHRLVDAGDLTVEDLVKDLERVTAERDQYLDASRRLQAEFENYRKAVAKRELEAKQRANESLVSEILPVLDACDGALASGAIDVGPVRSTLMDALVKQGLDRIDDHDTPFDPVLHDAVMHEPADDGEGPVVAEVLRAGYSWKGRVVRPAMVRVRG